MKLIPLLWYIFCKKLQILQSKNNKIHLRNPTYTFVLEKPKSALFVIALSL